MFCYGLWSTCDDNEKRCMRTLKDSHDKIHRVEVLLRQQAFKPKTDGVKASSSLRQHLSVKLQAAVTDFGAIYLSSPVVWRGFRGRTSPCMKRLQSSCCISTRRGPSAASKSANLTRIPLPSEAAAEATLMARSFYREFCVGQTLARQPQLAG